MQKFQPSDKDCHTIIHDFSRITSVEDFNKGVGDWKFAAPMVCYGGALHLLAGDFRQVSLVSAVSYINDLCGCPAPIHLTLLLPESDTKGEFFCCLCRAGGADYLQIKLGGASSAVKVEWVKPPAREPSTIGDYRQERNTVKQGSFKSTTPPGWHDALLSTFRVDGATRRKRRFPFAAMEYAGRLVVLSVPSVLPCGANNKVVAKWIYPGNAKAAGPQGRGRNCRIKRETRKPPGRLGRQLKIESNQARSGLHRSASRQVVEDNGDG